MRKAGIRGRLRRCGQGIIEYGGALVLAALLISTILAIFPNPVSASILNIMQTILAYFIAELPA